MNELLGKYLNGYKIVRIEKDPIIKGQINLFTDEWRDIGFGDKACIKFYVRDNNNSQKIYQELVDKENYELKKQKEELKNLLREYLCTEEYCSEVGTVTTKFVENLGNILNELEGNNDGGIYRNNP